MGDQSGENNRHGKHLFAAFIHPGLEDVGLIRMIIKDWTEKEAHALQFPNDITSGFDDRIARFTINCAVLQREF